jgi:multiple sugar transport system permease protein/raffinose/stachyose/melibiose transport system permease protein
MRINYYRAKRLSLRSLLLIFLLAYTFIEIGPLIWAFFMSLRYTNEILNKPYGLPIPPVLYNYIRVITEYGFIKYFRNSVIATGLALLISTPVAALAAYGFARNRYKFSIREVIFQLIFITIMFPPQITLISLYIMLWRYKLLNIFGLSIVYAATALPISIFLLRSFFAQIPQGIEDSARIDGANDWITFWRVMFPIARPALATVVVLNFLSFWNEFLYAVTLITKDEWRTLPLGVMRMMGDTYVDYGALSATLIISMAPIVILYLFLSESFIKGMTAGALKG